MMFKFIEDNNFLSQRNKDFIENTVLSNNFPYMYRVHCVPEDYNSQLVHSILERPERRTKDYKPLNTLPEMESILINFCRKNNIKFNEMLRACINFSYNNGSDKSPIHMDHEYPYKQLIVYFNDCLDKKSHTVILDHTHALILKTVVPEKYKGICFDRFPHYAVFPKQGHRIIGVITFR